MAGSIILVIDGDLASRNYLAQASGKQGHHILPAASGKEGVISAWRDHPTFNHATFIQYTTYLHPTAAGDLS